VAEAVALEEDTLFLACTRPVMIAGVTMEAMGVNLILTTVLFIVAGSILYAFLGLVFHVVFKAIVKHDYNMFRILMVWINTRGRARNGAFWAGSTVTPLRLQKRYDERDLSLV
jgi:type IV secretion system protein VirB3